MVPVSFLEGLSSNARLELLASGRVKSFAKGEMLFYEGDDGHDVLILTDGLIKVAISDEDGREVILDVLGAGDIAGELSAIDAGPRSATGTALNAVSACIVRHAEFFALLEREPSIGTALLGVVTRRLRGASRRQFEFGAGDALGRLSRSLCELDERYGVDHGAERVCVMPFGQQELAGHAGLSREAVVKALGALRNLGWVSVERRTVTIHQRAQISARATGNY